ncbi:MAG: hypothetical protein IKU34_03825 [Clostridia bacterium]|nr:hypothetical protein [Clostridia bacterium]
MRNSLVTSSKRRRSKRRRTKRATRDLSWDGREPKYDIRSWSAGRTKMGKGITLTEEELVKLYEVLKAEVEFLQSDDL